MFTWNWRGWLRALVGTSKPAARPTRRLNIDRLEDRTVPSASPTGVISGHAFNDLTGNGMSHDDTGLRGVTILLYADTNHNGRLDGRDNLIDLQSTKADGSYSFTRLAAGTYFVLDENPNNYVQTGPISNQPYKITIGNGQTAGGNDFDYFKLLSDSGLQNITYTIQRGNETLTVRDLRGNTREGDVVTVNFTIAKNAAPITLSLVSYDAPGSQFHAGNANLQTIADLDSATFGPGKHSLAVIIPESDYQIDFVVGAAINHFGPAGSNIFYSAEHRLVSADNGGTHRQADGSIAGFVYSDNDANSLVNSGDTGIAGVTVVLTGTNDLGKAVSITTTTDANGHFVFSGLRAGVYSVQQLPIGTYTAETDHVGSLGGKAKSAVLISDIHLKNGKSGVNYNFLDVAPVVAQPTTFSISGTVAGAVSNTLVTITDDDGQEYLALVNDDDGTYIVTGLPAGHTYTIQATADGGLMSDSTITVNALTADLKGQDLVLGAPF